MPGMKTFTRITASLLGIAFIFAAAPQAHADQAFYLLDKSARQGMLVSLSKNPDTVQPADTSNAPSLVGVIGSNDSNFDVQNDQVNVRTDGVADVLVTTIYGNIQIGDRISPSSILGFGAKQTQSGWIAGTAQGSLSPSTPHAVKTTITENNGKHRTVYAASIPVLIKVAYIPETAQAQDSALPANLQRLANTIAGKNASVMAVVFGFLLLIIGFVIAALITTASVRNGLSAISRQPLAKPHIVRQMFRSFAMALGILLFAVIGSMAIIRLL